MRGLRSTKHLRKKSHFAPQNPTYGRFYKFKGYLTITDFIWKSPVMCRQNFRQTTKSVTKYPKEKICDRQKKLKISDKIFDVKIFYIRILFNKFYLPIG